MQTRHRRRANARANLWMPDDVFRKFVRARQSRGIDRFDEMWNGVYVVSPAADFDHSVLLSSISAALVQALTALGAPGTVLTTPNVSDRPEHWERNYRCPDLAVLLPGNPAENRGTHLLGGPDLAIEVFGKGDRTRNKFAFYHKVGVREQLLVNRKPWALELFVRSDAGFSLLGRSSPDAPEALASTVLPLSFRLEPTEPRPRVEVSSADGRRWLA